MTQPERTTPTLLHTPSARAESAPAAAEAEPSETQAPPKPERFDPTRYGDWELNGKCVDF